MQNKIAQFYTALHGDEKTTFRFLPEPRVKDKKSESVYQKYSEHTVKHYQNAGYGAFHMVNVSGSKATTDESVKSAGAVFIDIDNADLPEHFALPPSFILSRTDGKGHHIYWLISPTEELEKWRGAQLQLIKFYDSDPAIHNQARLMRVPGSINNKPEKRGQTYNFAVHRPETRYDIDSIIIAHTDKKEMLAAARKYEKHIFSGIMSIEESERHSHKKFVKLVMRMNGLGFDEDDVFKELMHVNEKYCDSTYTENALRPLSKAGKHAKNKKGAEAVDEATQELLKQERKKDKVRELLKDWYYIVKQNLFINSASLDIERSIESFNRACAEDAGMRDTAGFALQHGLINKAETLHYTPAGELFKTHDVCTVYPSLNIWKDDRIKPETYEYENDIKWLEDHLNYLLRRDEVAHILDWLAFAIQNPGKRVNHVIVIIGHQGTGKTMLFNLIKQLFGPSNSRAPGNDIFSDKYTHWAKNTNFLLINELKQEGVNFYNFIKPFITDNDIEIREMYHQSFRIDNHMNIMAFSNIAEPLRIPEDDRRWYIVKSLAQKKTPAYYTELAKNCEEKAAQVYQWLLDRDLSGFNWAGDAPMTEIKKSIIAHSKSELELWIEEQMEAEDSCFKNDVVCVRDVMDAMPEDLRRSKFVSSKAVASILRNKYFAHGFARIIRVNGENKKFFAVRDVRKYMDMEETGEIVNYIKLLFAEAPGNERENPFET